MDTKKINRNKSIQVVDRCFAVLEELARNRGETTLVTLSKALSIPHSTMHRVLSSLISQGYVEQNRRNGNYRLGLKILMLSSVVLENMDLRNIAHEYLLELVAETGEKAKLVVLDRDEVVFVDKIQSHTMEGFPSRIGQRAPVTTASSGKMLLAELAQQDIIDILRSKGMPQMTPNSIIDVELMLDELFQVRKQGYAIDNEECEVGAKAIAAPVRDDSGRVIAAISISGPAQRFTAEKIDSFIPIITKCAKQISNALGFSGNLLKISSDN